MLISFKNEENTDEHIKGSRGRSASSRRDTAQGKDRGKAVKKWKGGYEKR